MKTNKMLRVSAALMASIALAFNPVYAEVVLEGSSAENVIIDTEALAGLCDGAPGELDLALQKAFNELSEEEQEFFAQELFDLADSVTDVPENEALEVVNETVADVAPELVNSLTQGEEGSIDANMALMVQNFLNDAQQIFADDPKMLDFLDGVGDRFGAMVASAAFETAGVDHAQFMSEMMGHGPDMMNAAQEFFAANGGDLAEVFANFDHGMPDDFYGQFDSLDNAMGFMEDNVADFIINGELDQEAYDAMLDIAIANGEITEADVEFMDRMLGYVDEGEEGEFDYDPAMFDHFDGEEDYFDPAGGGWGWDEDGFHAPEDGWTPEMMAEFEQFLDENDMDFPDNDLLREDLIQDQEPQQFEPGTPECQEHFAAPLHDPSSDGHQGC